MDTQDPRQRNQSRRLREAGSRSRRRPGVCVREGAARANLIARLKGNGSKRPLLIMGHTDTVKSTPPNGVWPVQRGARRRLYLWTRHDRRQRQHDRRHDDHGPAEAAQRTARSRRIFVAEAGEEAATSMGIAHLVDQNWPISKPKSASPRAVAWSGVRAKSATRSSNRRETPAGSRTRCAWRLGPRIASFANQSHLASLARRGKNLDADPPMRLSDTTRYYFEKLAGVSTPELAARYNALFNPAKSAAAREYLAETRARPLFNAAHVDFAHMIWGGYQTQRNPIRSPRHARHTRPARRRHDQVLQ